MIGTRSQGSNRKALSHLETEVVALEVILKISIAVPSVEGSSLESRQSIPVTRECAWWANRAVGGEAGETGWWVEISKGLCRAGTCSRRQPGSFGRDKSKRETGREKTNYLAFLKCFRQGMNSDDGDVAHIFEGHFTISHISGWVDKSIVSIDSKMNQKFFFCLFVCF